MPKKFLEIKKQLARDRALTWETNELKRSEKRSLKLSNAKTDLLNFQDNIPGISREHRTVLVRRQH